ncbi:MAG: hypothetical protein ABIT08_05835 [Bacteroidia bacterium]
MKKLIFALVFFVFVSDAYSQAGVGVSSGGVGMGMRIPINGHKNMQHSNRLENQVQELKHDLDLNDDQVMKVRSLLIERDRMRQSGNKMPSQDFDKRMQLILTSDQYATYNKLKQENHQQKKESKKETKKAPLPQSEWDDVYR